MDDSHFSLDEVREIFSADARLVFERIAAIGPATADADGLVAISAQCHALRGTAALVGLDRLALVSAAMEHATESAAQAWKLALRLRQAVANHVQEFKQLSDDALEGKGDDRVASRLVAALQAAEAPPVRRSSDDDLTATEAIADDFAFGELAESPAAPTAPAQDDFTFAAEETAKPDDDTTFVLTSAAEDATAEAAAEAAPPATTDSDSFAFDDEPAAPASGPAQVVDEELLAIFHEEATTALRQTVACLQNLNHAHLIEFRRLVHLVKGAAASVGLATIASLAKGMEQRADAAIDQVASAGLPDAMTLSTWRSDLRGLISSAGLTDAVHLPDTARISKSMSASPVAQAAPAPMAAGSASTAIAPELLEIFTAEASDLFDQALIHCVSLEQDPASQRTVRELGRVLHTLKGTVNTVGRSHLGQALHQVEDRLAELSTQPLPAQQAFYATLSPLLLRLRGALHGADAPLAISLPQVGAPTAELSAAAASSAVISPAVAPVPEAAGSALGDELTGQSVRLPAAQLEALMDTSGELVVNRVRVQRRLGALKPLQREILAARERLATALGAARTHEFTFDAAIRRSQVGESSFGDLEMDRYDEINVLARQIAEIGDDIATLQRQVLDGLSAVVSEVHDGASLAKNLQEQVLRARLLPVEGLFLRLRLAARDAAEREHKSLKLVVQGGSTLLDRVILGALYEPLLHLVRNAVGHGIEDETQRKLHGKDASGCLTMSAHTDANQVIIDVADDGAGLNLESLRKRGIALGLVEPDIALDDPRVRDLVFASGLSTRATADAVAGRGIGCDVVRRAAQRLGGYVEVRSEPGRGTLFRLSLPLSLAITRAEFVHSGGVTVAIPLGYAERIIAPEDPAEFAQALADGRLRLEDGYVALRSLGAIAQVADAPTRVIVLRLGQARLALAVDTVGAQEEIVVKPVGDLLDGHPLMTGLTITGDGDPVAVLDVPALLELSRQGHQVSQRAPAAFLAPVAEDALPCVVYVDDSLSVRKVAERALAGICRLELASDGADALRRLRELGPETVDMIFTDIEMPHLTGFDLLRELRSQPQWQHLPAVVVTSRGGAKHQALARELGVAAYLTKPFDRDELRALVGRLSPSGAAAS